jgi:alpha(1,3/1,4) fucosyltransferase
MKKWCMYVRPDLAAMGDRFFEAAELHGMKTDLYMYTALRDRLRTMGVDLHTQSRHAPEESDVVICLNETDFFTSYRRDPRNKKLMLILTEPPVYNMKDWDPSRHRLFDVVFTYDNALVESDRVLYRLIHFPVLLPEPPPVPSEKEFLAKSLSCIVAGAISITRSKREDGSLLFERYRIIKWYNRHHPDDLHFYSRTSPLPKFRHFRGAALLGRFMPALTDRIGSRMYDRNAARVYKGAIPALEKGRVMSAYRFNYCLENTQGIRGLISEKIFDCFAAGTVPIYFGAPDIATHIPSSCYMLYEAHKGLPELHRAISSVTYGKYLEYLSEARKFMTSDRIRAFGTDHFVDTIIAESHD